MPNEALIPGTRYGLDQPPGLYEDRARQTRPTDVRMDVAAFVGLTERGPVATAVALESWGDFLAQFGAPGDGRALPHAVHLFFANGGRRCVVSRALNYGAARTARWCLPVLRHLDGEPLELWARDPGHWGNNLQLSLTLEKSLTTSLLRTDADTFETHAEPPWTQGDLLRISVRHDGVLDVPLYRFISTVQTGSGGGLRLTLSDTVPALTLADQADVQQISAHLEVGVDDVVSERFADAGLCHEHPRFLLRLLQGTPRENSDIEEPGSRLVRPLAADEHAWLVPSLPPDPLPIDPLPCDPLPEDPLLAGIQTTYAPLAEHRREAGDDGATQTGREHFFEAPGQSLGGLTDEERDERPFRNQAGPLDALAEYNAQQIAAPITLVNLPDLVHYEAQDPLESLPESTRPPPTLEFTPVCGPSFEQTDPYTPIYPKLAASFEPETVLPLAVELAAWCSRVSSTTPWPIDWRTYPNICMAIIDLPPRLASHEIRTWRRTLGGGNRAALCAPYIRVTPLVEPYSALDTVPPGGAFCGTIAAHTRATGVHAAPANIPLERVVRLVDDDRLPGPRFLFDERVNLIREIPAGLALQSARTTANDSQWTHIPVRRLIDYLLRQLVLDARWAVFEPNDARLRARLLMGVERRLEALFHVNALRGANLGDAFFARIGATPTGVDGVVVEVGVAPAVPAEFIIFRLSLLREGQTLIEEVE